MRILAIPLFGAVLACAQPGPVNYDKSKVG